MGEGELVAGRVRERAIKMPSRVLEHILFQKALEYGGYDKIPVPVINDSLKVAYATGVILAAFVSFTEVQNGVSC